MNKLLGVAAIVMLFSIPVHAQSRGTSVGSAPAASANGGGGGIGGGAGDIGGTSARLPAYPRATFDISTVSGGDPSFAPSAFLPFEQAVAEGKAINDADRKSLAQVAAENNAALKAKAKFSFVQDANGKVVPTAQQ
jgi:hypothetical protein